MNTTKGFRELINPYLDRILDFYEYETDTKYGLSSALRHIEIVRSQLETDRAFHNIGQYESDLLDSVIYDSIFFEKKNQDKEDEWKVHFLRITWNRILSYLGIDLPEEKVSILKDAYIDSSNRSLGRGYRKYEGD